MQPLRKEELPTTGQSIPEFQFILCMDRNAPDKHYALVRHVGTGKVYDSRNCRKLENSAQSSHEVLTALWAMWVDQGKPETGFYLDPSDGPNYKPLV